MALLLHGLVEALFIRDWLLWCSCSKFQVFVADEIFLYIKNSSAYRIIFPTERRHSMSEGRLLMRIEKSNSPGYPLKRISSSVTNCLFMWYYYPVWSGFSVVCCSFFFLLRFHSTSWSTSLISDKNLDPKSNVISNTKYTEHRRTDNAVFLLPL